MLLEYQFVLSLTHLNYSGNPPIQCHDLGKPPDPKDIADIFSPVLGDVFHAMDRPKVPIKHEAKKSYFVAFQNAFFVWDEELMKELRCRMEETGLDEEEIDSELYFRPELFKGCVTRRVPPPSILYWRVRAVFALYGNMIDSKTNKPLFNKAAWAKAKNVLKEIQAGLYSDPPGVEMYTYKMENAKVKKNKYGMKMIEFIRGTNRTEAYHRSLLSVFGWCCGIEMSDCLLAERRHRHNHRVSEKRRLDFPVTGHYNTWKIDGLQNLVWKNHGIQLYSGWTNASDYRDTDESFDTVALHNDKLHEAVETRWDSIDQSKVKLTRDQKFMCNSIGTKLPFMPFRKKEENIQFAKCALDNSFPFLNDNEAAIEWCKFVDGVTIMPKLPVHIRQHREEFERNQRVKNFVKKSAKGKEALDKLNCAIKPRASSELQICMPARLPDVSQEAVHGLSNFVVGGVCIGDLPKPSAVSRKRGERGIDVKNRAPRSCDRYKQFCILRIHTCTGRGGAQKCDLFDRDGKRRCGRCARANAKDGKRGLSAYDCAAAKVSLDEWDDDMCEYYTKRGKAKSI